MGISSSILPSTRIAMQNYVDLHTIPIVYVTLTSGKIILWFCCPLGKLPQWKVCLIVFLLDNRMYRYFVFNKIPSYDNESIKELN
jgi:hypothetical protein